MKKVALVTGSSSGIGYETSLVLAREGYWIRQEKPTLNKQVAGRTDKEYYQDNQERIKQQVREYKTANEDNVK